MFNAVVYDIETFPNAFTLSACTFGNPSDMFVWEISDRRNDLPSLIQWLEYLRHYQTPMIGYNNLGFDYPVIHDAMLSPGTTTVGTLFAKSQQIINSGDRFGSQIWERDRLIPQIDLYKIHHFDNMAKKQSLKGLQFNMRSPSVEDMPVEHGTFLTSAQIDMLIAYNKHDVLETDRFAAISLTNMEFRQGLLAAKIVSGDVLNFNDTKIGERIFEDRLGAEVTHTRVNGRREKRQTLRPFIRFADIIFPYVTFEHPEFQRIHQWMQEQVITETKGVFPDVSATINGFTFDFGTGGIHGSVSRKVYTADEQYALIDIDVASLYPNIAIQNGLYPEHLGQRFVEVFKEIIAERKKHKKGTVENAGWKLAANGPYGKSNDAFSTLYDPQYTMATTINGQLMLCMLAERLLKVPTLEIIQINTDGITYRIHRDYIAYAKIIEADWQKLTKLELEEARYRRMFIRDVNNYIGEYEDASKPPKLKGAYVYYDTPEQISNASPSAWYKDLSSPIIQKAAEAAMLRGISPQAFIYASHDPFEFMLRAKATTADRLLIGDRQVQKITRYYIAKQGGQLRIVRPPTGTPGAFKRKNGIPEHLFIEVSREVGSAWDARIHTGNKSVHKDRETTYHAGHVVAECNVASHFDWTNLNREWYVAEALKLIIA